jgi:hypothetical protein
MCIINEWKGSCPSIYLAIGLIISYYIIYKDFLKPGIFKDLVSVIIIFIVALFILLNNKIKSI